MFQLRDADGVAMRCFAGVHVSGAGLAREPGLCSG